MFGKKENKEIADFCLYAVYDSQLESYTDRPPTTAPNNVELTRATQALFADPREATNPYLVHAEHFSVFKVGYYSKKTGVLTPLVPHEHVLNMIDIRSALQNKQGPTPVPGH